MEWDSNGNTSYSAESIDGEFKIKIEKSNNYGISETKTIEITKPANKFERLDRVEDLHSKGMTQTKIAEYTMTSQKTVSNDIREIKKRK